jgi:ankyrin repeat protein
MECDHRELNRYPSQKDKRYDQARGLLQNIYRTARTIVKKRLNASNQSIIDPNTFSRLQASLDVLSFRDGRSKVENASGDSQWILEEPMYLSWATESDRRDSKPCLCIFGDEGLGKTKAALSVIQDLEKLEGANDPTRRDVLVVYSFCDANPNTHSPENLLKSIIWQIILKRRFLAQYVRGFASQEVSRSVKPDTSISLDRLWMALMAMLRDPSAPEVFFVISGIHLLSKDNGSFLSLLGRDIISESDGTQDLDRGKSKWLLVGRGRNPILAAVEGNSSRVSIVNLNDGSKSQQLRVMLEKFVRDEVKSLASMRGYSLSLQFYITSLLQQRAENSQLWVNVVCRMLVGIPPNHVQVRKALENSPRELEQLIEQAWKKSLDAQAGDIDGTKEILRTLAVVFEDPTIDELKILAELDQCSGSDQVWELVRSCGPLICVYNSFGEDFDAIGSWRVGFVHELAKKSLLDNPKSRELIGLGEESGSDEAKRQHGVLGLRCLKYTFDQLTLDDERIDWDSIIADKEKVTPDPLDQDLDALFAEQDLDQSYEDPVSALEYPITYWLRHGNESTADFVETLDLRHMFWHPHSALRDRWWKMHAVTQGYEHLNNMTSMHVAAYFGSVSLVKRLLRDGRQAEIHGHNSLDHQPLHMAAWMGHVDVMHLLIAQGADLNDGYDRNAWTPLHWAAISGQIEAMKLLLSFNHVVIDAAGAGFGTPLTLALGASQTQAAILLLNYGASPIKAADEADSPLAAAAATGLEDLVVELLRIGAAGNMVSSQHGTALVAAASTGNVEIVNFLLPYDTSAESREDALTVAAQHDCASVVLALLQSSFLLNCARPFEQSAYYGHLEITKILWQYHQMHNTIQRRAIDAAMYNAASAEHEDVVQYLLESCRADPNALGNEYGNAITGAAFDGNLKIVQLLIDHGADVNSTNGWALQAATLNGFRDVILALLNAGAAVNQNSHLFSDGTALQAACVRGDHEIAQLLLQRGANPNLGAGTFTNPITAATSSGNSELLQLLIQARCNLNVLGGQDLTTPLINAAYTMDSRWLEYMIRSGAAIDTVDSDGDTALIAAANVDDLDCVKVLLKYHANFGFCGDSGSALHVAACDGSIELFRTLIEAGANPTVRGGQYDTVIQAAASSGNGEILKFILDSAGTMKNRWAHLLNGKIDVNAQGGEYFTALHAAAVQDDDRCLRLLLTQNPKLNVIQTDRANGVTPLQAAIFSRCNRNARLLIEAGADLNICGGTHGDILQVAALRGSSELVALLLERGVKIDRVGGKYQNPLAAAVVRDYHSDEGDTDVLEILLQKDFNAAAYKIALEQAFRLQRREAFKLIWKSSEAKGPRKLSLGLKPLMAQYQKRALSFDPQKFFDEEDNNSDIPSDEDEWDQDFYDLEEEEEEVVRDEANDGEKQAARPSNANETASTERGLQGQAFRGQQSGDGASTRSLQDGKALRVGGNAGGAKGGFMSRGADSPVDAEDVGGQYGRPGEDEAENQDQAGHRGEANNEDDEDDQGDTAKRGHAGNQDDEDNQGDPADREYVGNQDDTEDQDDAEVQDDAEGGDYAKYQGHANYRHDEDDQDAEDRDDTGGQDDMDDEDDTGNQYGANTQGQDDEYDRAAGYRDRGNGTGYGEDDY